MNSFDKKCFDITLEQARQSLSVGNYPVGALLAFDDQIVSSGNNAGETSKNYINHAETKLLIDNGAQLLRAATNGQIISLYSTLEPCLMCLGIATMNKVSRILYIQSDPHAGACKIDRASLGVRYQEAWPEIIHTSHTDESKDMIIRFLNGQITNNVRVEWSQKFLRLLETSQ